MVKTCKTKHVPALDPFLQLTPVIRVLSVGLSLPRLYPQGTTLLDCTVLQHDPVQLQFRSVYKPAKKSKTKMEIYK